MSVGVAGVGVPVWKEPGLHCGFEKHRHAFGGRASHAQPLAASLCLCVLVAGAHGSGGLWIALPARDFSGNRPQRGGCLLTGA